MAIEITKYTPKLSYLKKIKLILKGRRINMSNWLDILADVYQNRASIFLENKLTYPFLDDDKISYQSALKFVNRIAHALLKLGVKKGDRVVLITLNRVELLLACFAVMKIGAIAVPLNFMLKQDEIKYIVSNCEAKYMIIDRDVYYLNIKDKNILPNVKEWIMVTRQELPEGFHRLQDLIKDEKDELEPIELHPDDIVAILYTSGTTGFPKGAMLPNRAFSRSVRISARVGPLFPTFMRRIAIFALPVAHIMGYIMAIMFFAGGIPWLFIRRFDPQYVLEKIQEYKATLFIGVPAMYAMLSQAGAANYDLSSMKVWGAAADAMPIKYIKEFKKYGGIHIGPIRIPPLYFEGYGQVETVGITSLKTAWAWSIPQHGCVGKVVRGLKYKIVDENMKRVKKGEPGELVVKGERVCVGYWQNEEANKEAFLKDDWFRTGDILKEDRRGRLYFVDREKDVIKVGGYSVFSKEVEEEMRKHPAIQEVGVIGIKDEIKGQKPVAIVQLKPDAKVTEEELLEWAKENIAAYKAPRRIKILKELPLGMTMKVAKKELREMFADDKWDDNAATRNTE